MTLSESLPTLLLLMRRFRLVAALLVMLFAVSSSMDVAVEQARADTAQTPAQDHQSICVGLCGCHIGCLRADAPHALAPTLILATRPAFLLAPALLSRATELSTPPPKL